MWNPPAAVADFISPEGVENAPDYTVPDPEASPKPTWDELLAAQAQFAVRYQEMNVWIERADNALTNLRAWAESQRTEHIRALRIPLSVGIIPGHRIESIASLVALSQQDASHIEVSLPVTIDGQLITITDRSDLITYIAAISTETNRLHNVQHLIFAGLQEQIQRMRDEKFSVGERIYWASEIITAVVDRDTRFLSLFTQSAE